MRDAAILLLVLGGSLYALKRPWVGVILWTWLSLMNPHNAFAYSAASWPLAQITGICTLVGLLITRERQNPLMGFPVYALLALAFWVTLTLPFSIYVDRSVPLWERSMKIWLMIFVTLALIDTKRKFDVLVAVTVFSVAFFGIKGGVFTVATAGAYRVWGPGGFIGGNNEVALAMLMIIPLMRYLQLQMQSIWMRQGMMLAMLLCVVTALGTYSRGALVGAAAVLFFFWWKNPHKLRWGIAIVVVGLLLLPMMPEQWWDRMSSIQDAHEVDDSALGRINAWWNAWYLALDRFIGGGFMIYTPEVFMRYAPDAFRVHAAHSIYFQMLGEHGFVGLTLFLSIGVGTWVFAGRLVQIGSADPARRWCADLGAMVKVSMIGFGVTGAFLSLAYYDLPYYIMAITVLAVRFARLPPVQQVVTDVALA
jgi:probable O-glycosylation ligase (exosortase A-associated)